MKTSRNRFDATLRRAWGSMLFCLLATLPVLAQDAGKLKLAFRPAANFPVKDLGSSELKNGGGFEATFSYSIIPKLAVYGGWGWNTFSPKVSDPTVAHYEETGYRLGLQYLVGLSPDSKLNFVMGGGVVINHIESENEAGAIVDDSGHGPGWEADAGISIPLSRKWQMLPSVRYHSLQREISSGGTPQTVDLNYVSVGVAVVWTLAK